jgi:hypothetical protein
VVVALRAILASLLTSEALRSAKTAFLSSMAAASRAIALSSAKLMEDHSLLIVSSEYARAGKDRPKSKAQVACAKSQVELVINRLLMEI